MTEPFLGEIRMLPFGFPPAGWWRCDGTLMPKDQNSALFGLIGTTYGGDGEKNFALPKLEPVQGVPLFIALQGVYPTRN